MIAWRNCSILSRSTGSLLFWLTVATITMVVSLAPSEAQTSDWQRALVEAKNAESRGDRNLQYRCLQAALRESSKFRKNDLRHAGTYHLLGKWYQNASPADMQNARLYYEKEMEILRSTLSTDDVAIAKLHRDIAETYAYERAYVKAEAQAEEALRIQIESTKQDRKTADYFEALRAVISCKIHLGKWKEAQTLMSHFLEDLPDRNYQWTWSPAISFADQLMEVHRYDLARPYITKLLAEARKASPERVANVLPRLAKLEQSQKHLDEATKCLVESIKLYQQLGKKAEAITTLQALTNLWIHEDAKKAERCCHLWLDSIKDHQSPDWAEATHYLCWANIYQKNYKIALPLAESAYRLKQQLKIPYSIDTLVHCLGFAGKSQEIDPLMTTVLQRAVAEKNREAELDVYRTCAMYFVQKDPKKAERASRKWLDFLGGTRNESYASALHYLCWSLLYQNRFEEALPLARASYKMHYRMKLDLYNSVNTVAYCFRETGRGKEVSAFCDKVIAENGLTPNTALAAAMNSLLAKAIKENNPELIEKRAREAIDMHVAVFGNNDDKTAGCVSQYVGYLERTGQLKEARIVQARFPKVGLISTK